MSPFLIAYLFGVCCTLAWTMREFLKLWNQGSINVDVPGKWFQLQMGWIMFAQLVGSSVVWPLHIVTFFLQKLVNKNAAPNDVATLGVTRTYDKEGREVPPNAASEPEQAIKRPEGLPSNEVLEVQLAELRTELRTELNRFMPSMCADKHEISIAQALCEVAWLQMAAGVPSKGDARVLFLKMAECVSQDDMYGLVRGENA